MPMINVYGYGRYTAKQSNDLTNIFLSARYLSETGPWPVLLVARTRRNTRLCWFQLRDHGEHEVTELQGRYHRRLPAETDGECH